MEKIIAVPVDENIRKAENALRACSLSSHELIRMLGVVAKLYEEKLTEEQDTFRTAFKL